MAHEHSIKLLTKADLEAQGFSGFTTVRELQEGIPRTEEMRSPGVYAVVCSPAYKPSFIGVEEARRSRNVLMPWTLDKLRNKWVYGTEILYIGKTSSRKQTLRNRLTDFIRHSLGKTTTHGPHKGGELLWHLRGYCDFEVGFLPTDQPDKEERRLIDLFLSRTSQLPFGNRIPVPRHTGPPDPNMD